MANENAMNQDPVVPPEAEYKADEGMKHARKAAEDFRSSASAMTTDALERIRSFQDDGKQYVRENPTRAVFTALGVGFVLGLIFRR